MRISLARNVAILISLQLASATQVCSQQDLSRKRTVTSSTDTSQKKTSGDWETSNPVTVIDDRKRSVTDDAVSGSEPVIRVALATDVRSATISTTGHLLNSNDDGSTLVALDVARVRVEPHLLSPLPVNDTDVFQVQVAGLESRDAAEQKAKEVRDAINEDLQIVFDTKSSTWAVAVGPKRPQIEAEEIRSSLETAGLDALVVNTNPQTGNFSAGTANTGNLKSDTTGGGAQTVRATARFSLPTREVVATAAGAGRLFSSSAPVLFASDSQTNPVRFDDRPYRGRIEVFANMRGALTVVNVLGLEDYVKGVVPNELSAGGFPLLEAHKAQAIAARTYAMRNRGQFMSQGYDLLPTTRSQVYRGLVSENSLSSRAVDETRGIVATYNGEPINALYTSTCGGRTEDAGNIFNEGVPYLRGRECAAEGRAAVSSYTVRTKRDPSELKDEQNVPFARDVALLTTQNLTSLRDRVSDSWLKDEAEVNEVRSWLSSVARLAHQGAPVVTDLVNHPGEFATALSNAVYGESRAGTLLNNADVEYFLAVRDANEIPEANRADVAMMIRDGYMPVLPDATLRPREPLSRGRALHAIARILEARGFLQLQKATARPAISDNLVVRSVKGKDLVINVGADAFLFRQIGEATYPVRSVAIVGGEPVVFHLNASGEVDYLEVKPSPNGAAADRFSPFTNWTAELSLSQVRERLGRYASGIGSLTDLQVMARGSSRRATDLEVVGTEGTRHVLGGRIRSALGLREQLFVIERRYDEDGHVVGFTFLGRGWGHGVGMCQVGAYGLAKQGFSYDQILKAYYTGIDLTRMY